MLVPSAIVNAWSPPVTVMDGAVARAGAAAVVAQRVGDVPRGEDLHDRLRFYRGRLTY